MSSLFHLLESIYIRHPSPLFPYCSLHLEDSTWKSVQNDIQSLQCETDTQDLQRFERLQDLWATLFYHAKRIRDPLKQCCTLSAILEIFTQLFQIHPALAVFFILLPKTLPYEENTEVSITCFKELLELFQSTLQATDSCMPLTVSEVHCVIPDSPFFLKLNKFLKRDKSQNNVKSFSQNAKTFFELSQQNGSTFRCYMQSSTVSPSILDMALSSHTNFHRAPHLVRFPIPYFMRLQNCMKSVYTEDKVRSHPLDSADDLECNHLHLHWVLNRFLKTVKVSAAALNRYSLAISESTNCDDDYNPFKSLSFFSGTFLNSENVASSILHQMLLPLCQIPVLHEILLVYIRLEPTIIEERAEVFMNASSSTQNYDATKDCSYIPKYFKIENQEYIVNAVEKNTKKVSICPAPLITLRLLLFESLKILLRSTNFSVRSFLLNNLHSDSSENTDSHFASRCSIRDLMLLLLSLSQYTYAEFDQWSKSRLEWLYGFAFTRSFELQYGSPFNPTDLAVERDICLLHSHVIDIYITLLSQSRSNIDFLLAKDGMNVESLSAVQNLVLLCWHYLLSLEELNLWDQPKFYSPNISHHSIKLDHISTVSTNGQLQLQDGELWNNFLDSIHATTTHIAGINQVYHRRTVPKNLPLRKVPNILMQKNTIPTDPYSFFQSGSTLSNTEASSQLAFNFSSDTFPTLIKDSKIVDTNSAQICKGSTGNMTITHSNSGKVKADINSSDISSEGFCNFSNDLKRFISAVDPSKDFISLSNIDEPIPTCAIQQRRAYSIHGIIERIIKLMSLDCHLLELKRAEQTFSKQKENIEMVPHSDFLNVKSPFCTENNSTTLEANLQTQEPCHANKSFKSQFTMQQKEKIRNPNDKRIHISDTDTLLSRATLGHVTPILSAVITFIERNGRDCHRSFFLRQLWMEAAAIRSRLSFFYDVPS